jgi:soluble lytic murein transglycosylase-like protein
MQSLFIALIYSLAPNFNIDGNLAVSIAQHESKLNPNAIGTHKEVGLFQVRPQYSKYTAKQLHNPRINILEGLRILAEAKSKCKHKIDKTYVVCYNLGKAGGSRIKYPKQFSYYKKIMQEMDIVRLSSVSWSSQGIYTLNMSIYGEVYENILR